MRLHLASSQPGNNSSALRVLRKYAPYAPAASVTLTDDAESADIILFADDDYVGSVQFARRIRPHPLYRRWRDKCFLYTPTDWPMPLLPGLFPSAGASRPQRGLMKGCHYLNDIHAAAAPAPWAQRDLLFSFVGRGRTHPLRSRLLELRHERAILLNTDAAAAHEVRPAECSSQNPCSYCRTIQHSRFVLCPRGFGPSSYRIFEAMEWGCVPVIVSDDWTEPVGPDWRSLCLRIAEDEVENLVRLLEEAEPRANVIGRAARAAWEQWFSPAGTWRSFRLALEELQAERRDGGWTRRLALARHQLAPFHLKAAAGSVGREISSLFRR